MEAGQRAEIKARRISSPFPAAQIDEASMIGAESTPGARQLFGAALSLRPASPPEEQSREEERKGNALEMSLGSSAFSLLR
ncbi:hypothetical protein AOLI_G00167850 [Acnodon oligacanthus]